MLFTSPYRPLTGGCRYRKIVALFDRTDRHWSTAAACTTTDMLPIIIMAIGPFSSRCGNEWKGRQWRRQRRTAVDGHWSHRSSSVVSKQVQVNGTCSKIPDRPHPEHPQTTLSGTDGSRYKSDGDAALCTQTYICIVCTPCTTFSY